MAQRLTDDCVFQWVNAFLDVRLLCILSVLFLRVLLVFRQYVGGMIAEV